MIATLGNKKLAGVAPEPRVTALPKLSAQQLDLPGVKIQLSLQHKLLCHDQSTRNISKLIGVALKPTHGNCAVGYHTERGEASKCFIPLGMTLRPAADPVTISFKN